MKPTIIIKSNDNRCVTLIRGENVDDELWKSVVFWWRDSRNSSSNNFVISIDDFLTKRFWLRSKWAKEGGVVILDDTTKTFLKDAIDDLEIFKNHLTSGSIINLEFNDQHLKRRLTEFQKRDICRLLDLPAGANFSVPGAGKTTSELVVWDALKRKGYIDGLLVICPRSAFEAWINEPKEVFHENIFAFIFDDTPIPAKTNILILNYEKLENDKNFARIKRWLLDHKAMIVLDEAHRIKGGVNSIRWLRCKSLSAMVKRVDLLTGTPMPQSYDDLRNLFALSWPNVPRMELSDSALKKMKRGSIFVRTTKTELDLPPLRIIPQILEMGKLQSEVYSALRRAYKGRFVLSYAEESYFGAKGRAVMTLLAAASNPGLLAGITQEDAYLGLEWPSKDILISDSISSIVQRYASLEIPPKYIWIREFCQKARSEGRKVLVWSNLIGNILALNKVLEPLNPVVIYGATDNNERELRLKRFRENDSCSILISNPQTLGEGVSLHAACHEAIYLDRSYNAGQYLQSLDRIHRLGLLKNQLTYVHVLQSRYSIDQRISVRLEDKVTRLSVALDDAGLVQNSLPDDSAIIPDEILGINQYDLDDLFSHLTDE